MRKHLLMSTVALLAGLAVASAQQLPGGDGQRGEGAQKQQKQEPRGATSGAQKEQSREGASSRSKGEAQGKQAEQGKSGESKSGESKSGESKSGESKSSTTGQAGREQGKQAEPQNGKQGQRGKQAEQGKSGESKSSESKSGEPKSSTTGQGGREQGKQAEPQNGKKGQQGKNAERGKSEQGKSGTTGQTDREGRQAEPRQGEPKTDQQGRQGQTGQNQQGRQGETAGQGRGNQQGSVQLTTEQRTQIREQVLTRSNAPRVDSVNFSVSVGTAVPTSVRVVEVPDVLIRIHPEWRGHRYFVVRDEIVIVDNSHKIVSVVPVGSSGAQLDNRDRGSASVRSGGAVNLSVEEIREVQQVLVREGFDVEVDGKLGPKTHEALISFQRKNGLQASGQIDSQTVTKLGVNTRGSTTGQGSGQQGGNMPSREQGQRGGDRNQRSDQDRRDGNAPSSTQGRGDQRSEQNRNNANPPSTTGQGGERGNMPSREQGGNMPKSQQDGNQKGTPSNREQQK